MGLAISRPAFLGKASGLYKKIFISAFFLAFLVLLPFTIYDGGILFQTNDFKTQQIPFYVLTSEALKSGSDFSWLTDLGTPLYPSYAFYTLGSPFFLLVSRLPSAVLPYLMMPLLALKFGVAALSSAAYFKRYIKSENIVFICAFLYAFSGFQIFNMFYNHFHDVTALFPFLLIAMDELCENRRKGWFALTVAVLLMTNYVFFVGIVVFAIIYFIVKSVCGAYKFSFSMFFHLAAEAVTGVLASAFVLPAILFVSDNPRLDDKLCGAQALIYQNPLKYLELIRGILFPADSPQLDSFYRKNALMRWSSNFAYLPFFSVSAATVWIKSKKKHFASVLIVLSAIFMFVPVLNGLFSGLSSFYYARWFFMPVLIAALATGLAIEDKSVDKKSLIRVSNAMAIFGIAFGLVCGLIYPGTATENGFEPAFFLYPEVAFMVIFTAIMAGSLILLAKWLSCYSKKAAVRRMKTAVITVSAGTMLIVSAVNFSYNVLGNHDYIDNYINSRNEFADYKAEGFARVDTSRIHYNANMWWGLPSMSSFNSNIPNSLFDFYGSLGLSREVNTNISDYYYPLRSLFSVKYAFYNDDMTDYLSGKPLSYTLKGFRYKENRLDYEVYENTAYIPMGFSYDYYILEEDFARLDSPLEKSLILLKAVVLDETQAKSLPYLKNLKENSAFFKRSYEQYLKDCADRRKSACTEFTAENDGFSATHTSEKTELVFFSVPYDSSFKATVNGVETEVLRVSEGFTAVECPAGTTEIKLVYTPPYQGITTAISITAFAAIFCLIALNYVKMRKKDDNA